jgi:NhaP-type Na+/H+ or K+/H+ antiporter
MHDVVSDPRWFLLAGTTLILMALAGSVLRRLPLTASILYLGLGFVAGPSLLGLIRLDPVANAGLLELLAELAVVVSLFTAGLKLREPLRAGRWRRPVRLAVVSMTLTVALIALSGVAWLGLSVGAAVLLGAILAPTDPVLASDVQVSAPSDVEDLRFGLTGEAGLNDGSAFPFVMLGLGLLGLHELGPIGARWAVLDVAWPVVGGLAIGGVSGTLVGRLVLWLRRSYREALGLDEFLGLGLIGLSYGLAVVVGAYGFLAVFAAGLAVRRIELETTGEQPDDPEVVDAPERSAPNPVEVATDPDRAPAYMASVLLQFNEQLERIGEIAVVVVVGALLATVPLSWVGAGFAAVLFLVIRPVSVVLGLLGLATPRVRVGYLAWFGIRGIGSLYYLMFAITRGLDAGLARELTSIVLTVVTISIVVHGVSVTPLMERYDRWRARRVARVAQAMAGPEERAGAEGRPPG